MSDQVSTTSFRLEDFFTPEMVKMIKQSQMFEKKMEGLGAKFNRTFSKMGSKVQGFVKANGAMMEGLSEIPGLDRAMSMLTNPYVAAGAAVVGLGAAYVKCGKLAQQWETSMAKVNVTAQLTPVELKKVSDQILEIGRRSRTNLMEVPEAFNTIISAGLDVNQSMRALEPTLQAAAAGFTDVKTTADAAVSVMNSSGISDATKVYDVLFATMNKGKAEFADIARYLPKIIPASRNVGLSLEQTAGAYAYFTASGQTAEKSATLLENTFKVLGDPDKVKKFKAIGVSLYDNKGKIQPIVKIAEQLQSKLNGLSDFSKAKVLSSLGLDMEAGSAFASLAQNVDMLRESIEFTSNSAGQLGEAVKNSATSSDPWKMVSNELQAAMIGIGQTALPIWQRMGQGVLDAINWIKNLYDESLMFRDILAAWGKYFGWLWDVVTAGFKMAYNMVSMIWGSLKSLGTILDFVGQKVGLGKNAFSNLYTTVRPYLMWIAEILGKIIGIGYKLVTLDFKGAWSDIKNFKLPDIEKLKQQTLADANRKKDTGIVEVTGGNKPKTKIDTVITNAGGKGSTGGGAGGGVRNVQVTINKLVEKIEVHIMQPGRDSYQQIERTITEVLTKAVRDSEIALSTN